MDVDWLLLANGLEFKEIKIIFDELALFDFTLTNGFNYYNIDSHIGGKIEQNHKILLLKLWKMC